jgi:hypothetical protein
MTARVGRGRPRHQLRVFLRRVDKPLGLIREFGFTASQVRHMLLLAELGDKENEEYLREIEKRREAWEQAVARAVARRHKR